MDVDVGILKKGICYCKVEMSFPVHFTSTTQIDQDTFQNLHHLREIHNRHLTTCQLLTVCFIIRRSFYIIS